MHRIRLQATLLTIAFGAASSAALCAQANVAKAISQTDVSASVYGAFSGTTTGNGMTQSPSNAAGGIVEVRHIANPFMGFEGTYSFNRANQKYTSLVCPATGVVPGCDPPRSVSADAHEVTGDWIVSAKIVNLRPFALAGGGILFNQPSGGQSETSSSTEGVFVYGAGLDWGLLPHIGLRLQYRGNLYRAPDLTKVYGSSGAFTHTAEPMIGIYFRL